MIEVLLKYIENINPDKPVEIIGSEIVSDMIIIKYRCRTEFKPLTDFIKVNGIPKGGIQGAALEKWVKDVEVLNRDNFFTWCVDNLDDYDLIIDLNLEWKSNMDIM
ncbi:MAG: hypothetical protein PF487_12515 [Bacteroidales bacterium]|jgi:hypothetical protein|nr:hypothetical protein [Bacteroidales bacterium]